MRMQLSHKWLVGRASKQVSTAAAVNFEFVISRSQPCKLTFLMLVRG